MHADKDIGSMGLCVEPKIKKSKETVISLYKQELLFQHAINSHRETKVKGVLKAGEIAVWTLKEHLLASLSISKYD